MDWKQYCKVKVLVGIFSVLLVVWILLFYRSGIHYRNNLPMNFWNFAKEHLNDQKVFHNKTLTYFYEWNNTKGLPFHPNISALDFIGFPLTNFVSITDSTLKDFVFVTAINDNYATRALKCIGTIQEHFPEKKIILYDLGLSPSQITQVCFGKQFIYF